MADSPRTNENTVALGDDLLVGAEAIAAELNWLKPDGTPHRRRVYHLASQKKLPILNVPGLGLCARKSALRQFFESIENVTCTTPPGA